MSNSTIIKAQDDVIKTLQLAGYTNVKDFLQITNADTFPVVVVDLESTDTMDLSTGAYAPTNHNLSLAVYNKVGMSLKEARNQAINTFTDIMSILNLSLPEHKVEYLDTILSGIKLRVVITIIEVPIDSNVIYYPSVAITSEPSGANIMIDGKLTGILTPAIIRNAHNGTYSAYKKGYICESQEIDLSDGIDKFIHFNLEEER